MFINSKQIFSLLFRLNSCSTYIVFTAMQRGEMKNRILQTFLWSCNQSGSSFTCSYDKGITIWQFLKISF